MSNLTIRMEPQEKQRLSAWAASKGKNVTDYVKDLVAADMQAGSPESRALAWLHENRAALDQEAACIERHGIPGAAFALHYPKSDAEI